MANGDGVVLPNGGAARRGIRTWVLVGALVVVTLALGGVIAPWAVGPHGDQAALRAYRDANPLGLEELDREGGSAWMDGQTPDDVMLITVWPPYEGDDIATEQQPLVAVARWGDVTPTILPFSGSFELVRVAGAAAVPPGVASGGWSFSRGMPPIGTTIMGPVEVNLEDVRLKVLRIANPEEIADAWVVPSHDAVVVKRLAGEELLVQVYVEADVVGEVDLGPLGAFPPFVSPSPTGDYVTVEATGAGPEEPREFAIYGLDGVERAAGTSNTPPLYLRGGDAVATVESGGEGERVVVTDLRTGESTYESAWVQSADLPRAQGVGLRGDALIAVLCASERTCSIVRVEADGSSEVLYDDDWVSWSDVDGSSEHLIMSPRSGESDFLIEPGAEPVDLGGWALLPADFDGSRMVVHRADGSYAIHRDGQTLTIAGDVNGSGVITDLRWSDDGDYLWFRSLDDHIGRSVGVIDLGTGEVKLVVSGNRAASITNLTADGTGAVIWSCGKAEDSPCQRLLAWSSGEIEVVTDGLKNEGIVDPMMVAFSPDEKSLVFSVDNGAGTMAIDDFDVLQYTIGSNVEPAVLFEGAYLWKVSWYTDQVHGVVVD